jgi:hypothetical protein
MQLMKNQVIRLADDLVRKRVAQAPSPVFLLAHRRGRLCHTVLSLLGRILLFFTPFLSSFSADAQVTATTDPAEITLGEGSRLTVTVTGKGTLEGLNMPSVQGIHFQKINESSQSGMIFSFGGGASTTTSSSASIIFSVTADNAGSFAIPPIEAIVNGKQFKSNSLTLRVFKLAAALAQPATKPPAAPSPAAPDDTEDVEVPESGAAFVRLVYPKRDFYVGELVPVDMKIYVRQGVGFAGARSPAFSEAFSIGRFKNELAKSEEIIHGEPFSVWTSHLTVSAVKSGEFPLVVNVQSVLRVRVRDRSRRPSFLDNFFDDPFFDSAFTTIQEKQVSLRSKEATVKILPLPTEGQPADFSGAVGRFELSSSASPNKVSAGDPITLRATVSGLGNFGAKAPVLESTDGWKVYDPSNKFEPTDEIGFSGAKTFERPIVPQRADIQQVPPVKFTYFDPVTRKYVTLTSEAVPIQVAPATATPSMGSVGLKPASPASPAGPPPEELVPNKVELGNLTARLQPMAFQPWFLGVQLIPLAIVLLAWTLARRRERLAHDPSLARALTANRAIRAQLEAMNATLKQQNATAFFAAARRVLQERLGERFGQEPQAITLSEVENLLNDSPLLAEVRRIFEIADSVAYSGQSFSAETLGEWREAVLNAVRKLEKKR